MLNWGYLGKQKNTANSIAWAKIQPSWGFGIQKGKNYCCIMHVKGVLHKIFFGIHVLKENGRFVGIERHYTRCYRNQ
jgi:hypothetical protein